MSGSAPAPADSKGVNIAEKILAGIDAARSGLNVGVLGSALVGGPLPATTSSEVGASATTSNTTVATTSSSADVALLDSSLLTQNQKGAIRFTAVIEILFGVVTLAYMFYYIFQRDRGFKKIPVRASDVLTAVLISSDALTRHAAGEAPTTRASRALIGAANSAMLLRPLSTIPVVIRDAVQAVLEASEMVVTSARQNADAALARLQQTFNNMIPPAAPNDPVTAVRNTATLAVTTLQNALVAANTTFPQYNFNALNQAMTDYQAAVANALTAIPAAETNVNPPGGPNTTLVVTVQSLVSPFNAFLMAAQRAQSLDISLRDARSVNTALFTSPLSPPLFNGQSSRDINTAITSIVNSINGGNLNAQAKGAALDITQAMSTAITIASSTPQPNPAATSVLQIMAPVVQAAETLSNIIGVGDAQLTANRVIEAMQDIFRSGQRIINESVRKESRFTARTIIQLLVGIGSILGGTFLLIATDETYTGHFSEFSGPAGIGLAAASNAASKAVSLFGPGGSSSNASSAKVSPEDAPTSIV